MPAKLIKGATPWGESLRERLAIHQTVTAKAA
jgi:hypothetical protein